MYSQPLCGISHRQLPQLTEVNRRTVLRAACPSTQHEACHHCIIEMSMLSCLRLELMHRCDADRMQQGGV